MWFKTKEQKKKTPSADMTRSHADSLKKFYGLANDKQLAALYFNRYGFEVKIHEEKKV